MSISRNRARRQLLLVAVLFLTPFFVAVALRFGGWEPPRTRNHGALLDPPLPMHVVPARQSGEDWVWENTERHWSLLVQVPAHCDATCAAALDPLPNVHLAQGRHMPKLHPFRLAGGADLSADQLPWPQLTVEGDLPGGLDALPAALPRVWLVDPHGYLVMRYDEGFDPSGLRRDLSRLIK
ncbi:MAG: hypothetical protein WCZ65_05405 [Lysobacteraceae bacterium]